MMTSPKRFATTGLHDSVAFQPTQTASPNSDAPGDRSLCANGTTYRDRAAETDKLKTRIENSSASVIGIAGPRGAGKSSFALRVLDSCNSDSAFTHVVHSPTGYESREFLIAIFQSTCQKTVANINDKLKQDHLLTEPVDDERARFIFIDRFLRWFAPMLAVLLAVVIAYQIFVAREPSVEATFPPILSDVLNANLTLVILPLVLMFVLPSLSMWTRQFIRRKINILTSHRSEAKLKRRALDWSEHLRFQTSRSNTTQAKVSFLESLFGFSSTKNLITRDLSLPLLTSEFSSFLQEVCQVYPRVVICLDELDKIEDPEDLDKLLRGIKGVLGQHGVHFLLTVSDDALVRFSRRRQERGIVESAFESIEVLDRVDLEAADYMVDLMYSAKDRGNGRAPVHIATVLLWLFGGGIPREIKRNALACLEKGLRPRFESAERIWNVLFRARIDEVQAWIRRTGREDQPTHEFLSCLAKTRALFEAEDACAMESARTIVELWHTHLVKLCGEALNASTESDKSDKSDGLRALNRGRAAIDILIGASGLAYVLAERGGRPYRNHLRQLEEVLEWSSSNLKFAGDAMNAYLQQLEMLDVRGGK